jgi:hypothetical protein
MGLCRSWVSVLGASGKSGKVKPGWPGFSVLRGSASTQFQIATNAGLGQSVSKSVDLDMVCPNVQNKARHQQLQAREKQGLDSLGLCFLDTSFGRDQAENTRRRDMEFQLKKLSAEAIPPALERGNDTGYSTNRFKRKASAWTFLR